MQPVVMDMGTGEQASGSGLDKVSSCPLLCPDIPSVGQHLSAALLPLQDSQLHLHWALLKLPELEGHHTLVLLVALMPNC